MSIPSLPPVLEGRDAKEAAWAAQVDTTGARLVSEWDLRTAGPAQSRDGTWTRRVRTCHGPATLTLDLPADPALDHVALAFQHWAGEGAPRLLRADPRRRAVLLAGHPGHPLLEEWDLQACERIAGLYPALHRTPPPRLPRLSTLIGRWAAQVRPGDVPVPRRLVEQAVHLARSFAEDPGTDVALLHADLHFTTVQETAAGLVAVRPRPIAGDPHAEPAPLLWHRWAELDGYLREGLRRRLSTMIDAAGLDEQRTRGWAVVRAVVGAHQQGRRNPRERLDPRARERVTRFIAVAKAVQD